MTKDLSRNLYAYRLKPCVKFVTTKLLSAKLSRKKTAPSRPTAFPAKYGINRLIDSERF
jgi:hypothetical protein